jgi:hypothetical protein
MRKLHWREKGYAANIGIYSSVADVINWGDEYHGISLFSISRSVAKPTPA